MQTIVVKPLLHKGKEVMGIYFTPQVSLDNAIKRIKDVRWSNTNTCWYLPCNRVYYTALCNATWGIANTDTRLLKVYLEQKQGFVANANTPIHKATVAIIKEYPLNKHNLCALIAYRNLLIVKRYSNETVRSYCNYFHQLLRLLGIRNVEDLSKDQLHSYLLWLVEKRKSSETALNTTINALKFTPLD